VNDVVGDVANEIVDDVVDDADDVVDDADDADDAVNDVVDEVGDDDAVTDGPSRRWARVGGAVSLAYLVWYVLDLLLYAQAPSTFNAAHRLYGNVGVRAILAVVLLGILVHGTDGMRVTLIDLRPRLVSRDPWLRAAARFVTFAVWIPMALALFWPLIRSWIAG